VPSTTISPDALRQQAEGLLQAPTAQDPSAVNATDATKTVAQAMPDLFAGGQTADAAKQRVTQIVAAQAHISQQDAQQRVDAAIAKFNQDKQQAVETAKSTADASAAVASQAAFLAFVALLVGAVAGALGGAIATPRRVGLRRFR
jgi:CHASE3 domain sensor protein